jgi:hypothetical protein
MTTFTSFSDEILINIFKFIRYPFNLSLTNKNWNRFIHDNETKC